MLLNRDLRRVATATADDRDLVLSETATIREVIVRRQEYAQWLKMRQERFEAFFSYGLDQNFCVLDDDENWQPSITWENLYNCFSETHTNIHLTPPAKVAQDS